MWEAAGLATYAEVRVVERTCCSVAEEEEEEEVVSWTELCGLLLVGAYLVDEAWDMMGRRWHRGKEERECTC
jgi:hypothetical protein